MSNPLFELYCDEPNNGELLSQILVYEFEHITQIGGMCVTIISFSQPGFIGSKVW